MEKGWHQFAAAATNLTLVGDAGDFFQLIGGSTPWRLLECRVWQRGSTTLAMDDVRITRGSTGAVADGNTITEYEYATGGPAPTVEARSLPTTDVGSIDFQYFMGWNILADQLWLPTPRLIVPCGANIDIAIGRGTTTAHTGVGVQVVWEEFIGT